MIIFMTAAAPDAGAAAALDGCIARIAQGSQEALAQLYDRTRPAVYGFALSILKSPHDAEDVLHDAYLQVWNAAGDYRSQGKPMAWMMTIVRNLAMDHLRRQSRTQSLEEAGDRFAHRPDVTQEDRLVLESLLNALGDEERQVVTLHALSGLKHREIAVLLGMPLPTVLSKYSRAMKKLQQAWKEGN